MQIRNDEKWRGLFPNASVPIQLFQFQSVTGWLGTTRLPGKHQKWQTPTEIIVSDGLLLVPCMEYFSYDFGAKAASGSEVVLPEVWESGSCSRPWIDLP
jgi:hypothetical protein